MRWQLRMYRVKDGELDAWIDEWRRRVLPLRRSAGFEVLGPWVEREERLFVWLLGHHDFEAADAAYYASPERTSLDPDPARHLEEIRSWLMEDASLRD